MKPRIKLIGGYWRVTQKARKIGYVVSFEETRLIALAQEWCRRMNQQTKIAATFALLGIPQ